MTFVVEKVSFVEQRMTLVEQKVWLIEQRTTLVVQLFGPCRDLSARRSDRPHGGGAGAESPVAGDGPRLLSDTAGYHGDIVECGLRGGR